MLWEISEAMSHKSEVRAGMAPSAISVALAVWLQREGTPRLLFAPSLGPAAASTNQLALEILSTILKPQSGLFHI